MALDVSRQAQAQHGHFAGAGFCILPSAYCLLPTAFWLPSHSTQRQQHSRVPETGFHTSLSSTAFGLAWLLAAVSSGVVTCNFGVSTVRVAHLQPALAVHTQLVTGMHQLEVVGRLLEVERV